MLRRELVCRADADGAEGLDEVAGGALLAFGGAEAEAAAVIEDDERGAGGGGRDGLVDAGADGAAVVDGDVVVGLLDGGWGAAEGGEHFFVALRDHFLEAGEVGVVHGWEVEFFEDLWQGGLERGVERRKRGPGRTAASSGSILPVARIFSLVLYSILMSGGCARL